MTATQYTLRRAANGWIVEAFFEDGSGTIFVFDSARELGDWLAQRHGESSPRQLIADWN